MSINPRWLGVAMVLIVALFFTGNVLFLWLLAFWTLLGLVAG
jgi:hypothetical protein